MKHLTPAEMAACKAVAMTPQERARPIILAILKECRVTKKELASDLRSDRVARARQIIMAALHDRDFPVKQISALLGRDRTTVNHGIEAEKARAAATPVMFRSRRTA